MVLEKAAVPVDYLSANTVNNESDSYALETFITPQPSATPRMLLAR